MSDLTWLDGIEGRNNCVDGERFVGTVKPAGDAFAALGPDGSLLGVLMHRATAKLVVEAEDAARKRLDKWSGR